MLAAVTVLGHMDISLAELELPAGAPGRLQAQVRFCLERDRLFEEADGLFVGECFERLGSRALEVVDRTCGDTRFLPVMRKERVKRREVIGVGPLVPFRQLLM